MKKLSTLFLAALMTAPVVMAADVTVSLHVRKGSMANITPGALLGTMTNTVTYNEATGVYSITNFLGYEKGNLDFTLDPTEKFTGANDEERIPLIFSIPEGSIIDVANPAKSKWQFVTTDMDLEEEEVDLENFYLLDSGVFEGKAGTEFDGMKLVDANLWGVCDDTSSAAFENIKKRSYAVATANGYDFVIEVNTLAIRYSYGSGYTYCYDPEFDGFDFELYYIAVFPSPASAGVDEIVAGQEGEAEYFNLLGVRVENPTTGLYIKRQGGKTQKVIIK